MSLENLYDTMVILMEKLNMQVSEIYNLYFYDMEYIIESYKKVLEEREKQESKQQADMEKKYNLDRYKNPKNFTNGLNMPKPSMPKMPHF